MRINNGRCCCSFSRYHSLVPILKEVYESGHDYYHSVAVVKKGTMLNVERMRDLKGAKACFPKVQLIEYIIFL